MNERLSVGGFVDPAAESNVAAEQLETRFRTAPPNYVLVATALDGDVVDAANTQSGLELVERVRATDGVLDVTSAWTLGSLPEGTRNPLRSIDGHRAVVALRLGGDEDKQRAAAIGWPATRAGRADSTSSPQGRPRSAQRRPPKPRRTCCAPSSSPHRSHSSDCCWSSEDGEQR